MHVTSCPPPCVAVEVNRPAGLLRSAPFAQRLPVASSMACTAEFTPTLTINCH